MVVSFIWSDTINLVWSIVYYHQDQVKIPKLRCISVHEDHFILAKIENLMNAIFYLAFQQDSSLFVELKNLFTMGF